MKFLKNPTVIISIVIVIAGIVAYVFYFGKPAPDTVTLQAGTPSIAEAVFLNLASEIDQVNFDTSIFTDPRFLSLVDISVAIVPEAQGRKDPFSVQ